MCTAYTHGDRDDDESDRNINGGGGDGVDGGVGVADRAQNAQIRKRERN